MKTSFLHNYGLLLSKLLNKKSLHVHSPRRSNHLIKFSSFFFLLIIFSCTKEKLQENIKHDEKSYEVDFAVAGLNQDVKDLNLRTKNAQNTISAEHLSEQIKQLAFIIYDEEGFEFSRKIQLSHNENFGTFSKSLPVGQYTVVVVGSRSLFGINRWYEPRSLLPLLWPLNTARMMYEQPYESPYDHLYKTDDTFFRRLTFSVTPGENIMDIELQRIVGKLEFDIKDVNEYSVNLFNEATDFLFETETSAYEIEDDNDGFLGTSSNQISLFILRTDKPLKFEIRGGGKSKILSVPIFKNKRTIVSGNLLAESLKGQVNVAVDDVWNTDSVVVKF